MLTSRASLIKSFRSKSIFIHLKIVNLFDFSIKLTLTDFWGPASLSFAKKSTSFELSVNVDLKDYLNLAVCPRIFIANCTRRWIKNNLLGLEQDYLIASGMNSVRKQANFDLQFRTFLLKNRSNKLWNLENLNIILSQAAGDFFYFF